MADLSDTVGKSFSNSVAQLVDKAFQSAIAGSKEGANIVAAKLALGFEHYVATTVSKCSNVKTLISPNEPVQLDRAYEPSELLINSLMVPIDEFLTEIGTSRNHALITATLGSGKSFTMKYIYCALAKRDGKNRIPVFIELRNVPFSEKSLVSYINDALAPFTNFVSDKSINSGLKTGVFALVLDGFDEIGAKHRRAADSQINKLAADYPNNIIIVSSRPDESRFVSWHAFPEYRIQPLSLEKLVGLVERIENNELDKASFINRVKSGLYKTHNNILSNPLLASMMLLTYKEFQEIPSKMHVFYGTAFDVLYRKHDSTKPDYQREFRTSLDLADFKRLFTTFCMMTYIDRVYSFSPSKISRYAAKSIEYEEMNLSAEDFFYDLKNSICIMHQEGEEVSFLHRSFQEYFAALFLSKRSVGQSYDLIDGLVAEADVAGFFDMLMEIDTEEFERKYLIPKLERVEEELTSAKTPIQKLRALSSTYAMAKIENPEADKEGVDFSGGYVALFMPFTIKGKEDEVGSNLASLIDHIGHKYALPIYVPDSYGISGWENEIPLSIGGPLVRVVYAKDLGSKIIRASGILRYVSDLIKRIKSVRREMDDRHARKSKLLSDFLRKK